MWANGRVGEMTIYNFLPAVLRFPAFITFPALSHLKHTPLSNTDLLIYWYQSGVGEISWDHVKKHS